MRNNNSLIKTKFFLAILIMLILIGIVFTVVLYESTRIAYADSNNEDITQLSRKYTDTISPNGIDFNQYKDDFILHANGNYATISSNVVIKLAKGSIYSAFSTYSGSNYVVDAKIEKDDNIVKLIPRTLFTYVNKTIFVGKAYGFAIITEQLTDTVLKSTVILLNVTGSVSDYLADIKVEVACTLDFVYINQTAAISLPAVSTGTTENVLCTFSLLNRITSAVVPLPKIQTETLATGRTTKMMYVESKDYMLGNISFAGQIRNQNDYNIGDAQYDVNNDYGYFFIGNNYKYSATKYKSQTYENISKLPSAIIKAGIDILKAKNLWVFEPPSLFTVAQNMVDICQILSSINTQIEYNESTDSYGYTPQYFPNTRQTQTAAFGALVRGAHLILQPTDKDTVFFRKGNYANAQFNYSHTDGKIQYTQFEFSVGANIYRGSDRENVGAVVSPSAYYDINEPQTNALSTVGDVNYYMLPYGSQSFSFAPYNGKFVVASLDDNIDLYANGKKIAKSNGTYTFALNTNQKIVLKNKSATSKEGQFKFDVKSVSTTDETVGLQSGKSSVVKFQPTETGIYKFAVNGAQIQDILTNQYNGELEHARTLNSSFVKSATMSIVCKKNASYYIIIKGDNTATSASVSATKDNASWSVGTNGSFVSGANISYHLFTAPAGSSKTEYVVTFENAQNLNYIVVNDNADFCDFVYKSDGYLRIRNVEPNKKYYVGVYSEQGNSVIPTVKKNTADIYTWKITQNGTVINPTSSGMYLLPRGATYKVSLYVNGKYKYNDLVKTSDSLINLVADSMSFDTTDGTLQLTAARDIDSHLTISAEGVDSVVLSVKTTFNPNEIGIASVNMVNAIDVTFKKSDYITSIDYTVSGRSNAQQFTYSGTSTNGKYTGGLKDLFKQGAVGDVQIAVTRIKIKNKYSGDVLTRTISNVNHTIKCSDTDVYNALQLYNIRNHSGDTFTLKNNIDVSTLGVNWTPIPSFSGNLKGKFKVISGVKINIPATITGDRNFGLFGKIETNGTLTSFTIKIDIASAVKHGDSWVNVGGIAGVNYGGIVAVSVQGNLVCNRNRSNLGGLVGANYKGIGLSSFKGTVYGNGELGGCVGYNVGTLNRINTLNSTVTHFVEGEAHSVGGIVGYCAGGSLICSNFNTSTLNVGNSGAIRNIKTRMGTIVGHLENSTMRNDCVQSNSTWTSGSIKDTTYCFKYASERVGRMDNSTITEA